MAAKITAFPVPEPKSTNVSPSRTLAPQSMS